MDKLIERLRIKRFRVTLTANGKRELYHVTKFYLNLCFTVHFFYPKNSSFRLVLSITYVLDCFICTFWHYFCRFN